MGKVAPEIPGKVPQGIGSTFREESQAATRRRVSKIFASEALDSLMTCSREVFMKPRRDEQQKA